ncbi:hypothetical protein [Streptomyces sp. NPDC059452]|uniref:hypothetical protein n=1 Tax=Streptomyces sp. NPDC059452 TaxID=3346835 RepID=UPI0036871155
MTLRKRTAGLVGASVALLVAITRVLATAMARCPKTSTGGSALLGTLEAACCSRAAESPGRSSTSLPGVALGDPAEPLPYGVAIGPGGIVTWPH